MLKRVENLERIYKRKVEDPDLSDPSSRWDWRARAHGLWPIKRTVEDWVEAHRGERGQGG